MANVGSALRTYLLANGLGGIVGQRMYPDVLKQNATLPAVVYHKISTRRYHTVDTLTRTASTRVELVCYGINRANADLVAEVIRSSGIFSFNGIVDNIQFFGTELDSGDEYRDEPPTDGNQVHRYLTTFDLLIHHSEAA